MKRIPTQGLLPLDRKAKVALRQWKERAAGKKVKPGPGRPPRKKPRQTLESSENKDLVSHAPRSELNDRSALHITLRVSRAVPSLRSRKRYAVIRNAFVKFAARGVSFRLVHFAVLSNHLHFIVEADSKHALSMGMQRLLHSISRRLNALSVREQGGRQKAREPGAGYRSLAGWLGRVFADRYHVHALKTPTEMERAVAYVRDNAKNHYGAQASGLARVGRRLLDTFSSFVRLDHKAPPIASPPIVMPGGFLLRRACTSAAAA